MNPVVRRSLAAVALSAVALLAVPRVARSLDVITREELKETALEYGAYSQRFVTCHMEPPVSVRIAFLKYARSRGASDEYLDLLVKVFDEGAARVRNLKTGFSKEECEAKLQSPKGKEILRNIEEWNKLPAKGN